MSENKDLNVGGFTFNSDEEAEQARQELQKIEYLEKRMNYSVPENILAVYQKVLENKLVNTPVGWAYLRKMQQRMEAAGIEAERIPPIPLYGTFIKKTPAELINGGGVKQRIRPAAVKEKTVPAKYRRWFGTAVIVAVILCIMIIAMFSILLASDNPNIVNYERVLQNKYSTWEQELDKREQTIRARERELSIGAETQPD